MNNINKIKTLLEDLTLEDIHALMLFLHDNQYSVNGVWINQWRLQVSKPTKDI